MGSQRLRRGNGKRRDAGYMLLVLMLAVALLTITLMQVGLNYRRTILRDREVEMIHRGVQYERAVQLYYRKFGRYPTSIEQLENTNEIRFLRKRYKDPMSPDGQWQIAHITDIKLPGFTLTGAAGAAVAAQAAGAVGLAGAAANTALAAATALQTNSTSLSSAAAGTALGTDSSSAAAGSGDTTQTAPGTSAGSGPADTGPASGNGAGPLLGGGPMLGVISKSKVEGIHSFNNKDHFNEWYFIYDPSQDRPGVQLNGPYNPNLALGATTTATGTPAGQSGTPASSTSAAPATAPGAPTPPTSTPATPTP